MSPETDTSHVLATFEIQAQSCAALGSPMCTQLLTLIVDDIRSGGAFAELLSGHEDDPGPSALALRLLGGLHRVVLGGQAPDLARWYPSVGGTWDASGAWTDVLDTARRHRTALRTALDQPPQTNEVGRSAALIGGLMHLTERDPLPVRLFEIGTSAGLNLRADQYRYRYLGRRWGPADSVVVIDDAWQGSCPSPSPVQIVERRGFDIAPLDALTPEGQLTLLSYVWPDMTARLQRIRGAIEIAHRVPAYLQRASAADAVTSLRLASGTLTVLWHSVMWQYLSRDEQDTVTQTVQALGERADKTTPFAWLTLEPQRPAPGAPHEFLIRARSWPGAMDEILGTASPHGPPVRWQRARMHGPDSG